VAPDEVNESMTLDRHQQLENLTRTLAEGVVGRRVLEIDPFVFSTQMAFGAGGKMIGRTTSVDCSITFAGDDNRPVPIRWVFTEPLPDGATFLFPAAPEASPPARVAVPSVN
jgi:hypothetical protein